MKVFCDRQESCQSVLPDAHLPLVHEVQHGGELLLGHTSQVQQGCLVATGYQDSAKERGARGKNNSVCLQFPSFDYQGHILQLLGSSQFSKTPRHCLLEFSPFEAKLLWLVHVCCFFKVTNHRAGFVEQISADLGLIASSYLLCFYLAEPDALPMVKCLVSKQPPVQPCLATCRCWLVLAQL